MDPPPSCASSRQSSVDVDSGSGVYWPRSALEREPHDLMPLEMAVHGSDDLHRCTILESMPESPEYPTRTLARAPTAAGLGAASTAATAAAAAAAATGRSPLVAGLRRGTSRDGLVDMIRSRGGPDPHTSTGAGAAGPIGAAPCAAASGPPALATSAAASVAAAAAGSAAAAAPMRRVPSAALLGSSFDEGPIHLSPSASRAHIGASPSCGGDRLSPRPSLLSGACAHTGAAPLSTARAAPSVMPTRTGGMLGRTQVLPMSGSDDGGSSEDDAPDIGFLRPRPGAPPPARRMQTAAAAAAAAATAAAAAAAAALAACDLSDADCGERPPPISRAPRRVT